MTPSTPTNLPAAGTAADPVGGRAVGAARAAHLAESRQRTAAQALTPDVCRWVDRRAAAAWDRQRELALCGPTQAVRDEAARNARRLGDYLVDQAKARKWRRPPGTRDTEMNRTRCITGVHWHRRDRRAEVYAHLVDLGCDVGQWLDDTKAELRWRAAESISGLRTRTEVPRDMRLRMCGRVHPALCGERMGLAHTWCRDRMCPACGEMRARQLGSALRAWTTHRAEQTGHRSESKGGARLMFVTLTQPKRSASEETATEAVGRAMQAIRDLTNPRTLLGLSVRGGAVKKQVKGEKFTISGDGVVQGGARALELTYAARGQSIKGHRVEYSGWHAHFHCVFELAPTVSFHQAQRTLTMAWTALTGASPAALDFQPLNMTRVGQLAKYCVKPGQFAASGMVEAARALEGRKLIDGFGTWRGCAGKGRELADAAAEEKKTDAVRVADQAVGDVSTLAEQEATRPGLKTLRFAWAVPGGEYVEKFEHATRAASVLKSDSRTWERKQADLRAVMREGKTPHDATPTLLEKETEYDAEKIARDVAAYRRGTRPRTPNLAPPVAVQPEPPRVSERAHQRAARTRLRRAEARRYAVGVMVCGSGRWTAQDAWRADPDRGGQSRVDAARRAAIERLGDPARRRRKARTSDDG